MKELMYVFFKIAEEVYGLTQTWNLESMVVVVVWMLRQIFLVQLLQVG